ncbi:MAG: cytochrome c biogenesis protein CcsA [Alphaproteobacteria bacterium]|nr:cytochrome c biogenesis protein CcsA [Alphaproteobacteria bacterium]NCQ88660.1 cytochrome c biogenesis protein CcsA [Alphaproteobacteria bacterium]NCT06203.1 cytochrome c biogenesis protein CcsA [Alphaproteobacteria bacterium]
MKQIIVTFFVLVFFFLQSGLVQAKEDKALSLSHWSSLPILYEGRLKPIDSFSSILLEKISGRRSIDGLNANRWLLETIFDPARAMERPIFYVAAIKNIQGIDEKTRFINYLELATIVDSKSAQIRQLLDTDEQNWSQDQEQFMTLYQSYILFTQLLRSLTAILPLPIDLDNENTSMTYLDLKKNQQDNDLAVKNIIDKKGMDPATYSPEELKQSAASFQLDVIEQAGINNVLFRIIPTQLNDNWVEWVSPWDMLLNGKGTPKSGAYLSHWTDMARAYQNKDQDLWRQSVQAAHNDIKTYVDQGEIKSVKVETYFNLLPFKEMAAWLYGLCLIIGASLFSPLGQKIKIEPLQHVLTAVFIGGLISHTIFIIFRVIILERPPVGTLYESLLFVSLICAGVMFIMALKQKHEGRVQSIIIGALSSVSLLFISYGLKDTNSMPTLVAVLNTNFWLAVHVLCITIGYGFCVLAGCFAHLYLFQKIKNTNTTTIQKTFNNTIMIAIFALLFTTVGTILGGIWADQSWGRFWGWDPKENGALLIVLWLIWLIHSRISGHLREFGFIVGMAFINIIVTLAWFGVNLLSVGLHSYGFIEGIAASIALFCTFEIVVITTLAVTARKKAA